MHVKTWKLLVPAVLLVSLDACDSKRVKECVNRCAAETESCERRHEQNCQARGRECGEACERAAR